MRDCSSTLVLIARLLLVIAARRYTISARLLLVIVARLILPPRLRGGDEGNVFALPARPMRGSGRSDKYIPSSVPIPSWGARGARESSPHRRPAGAAHTARTRIPHEGVVLVDEARRSETKAEVEPGGVQDPDFQKLEMSLLKRTAGEHRRTAGEHRRTQANRSWFLALRGRLEG